VIPPLALTFAPSLGALDRLAEPAWQIVLRCFVVYVVVLLGLRLSGKRQIGQFTPFDLVLILLIANAVQNAMVGPDTSLLGGLIAAMSLLAINAIVSRVVSSDTLAQRLALGTPTLLVSDGRLILEHMRREGVTENELLTALREHGLDSIDDAKLVVLEIDGTISVVPKDAKVMRGRRRVRQIKHG